MKKSTQLKDLRDGKRFRLSLRPGAVWYTVQTKRKGRVFYTSESSGRTYSCKGNLIVFTY